MRLLVLLGVLLASCSPKLAEGTHLIEDGEQMLLTIGERLRMEKRSPDLFTFLEVIEDSRCPRGVNCIQAGRAVVAVNVLRDGRLQRETITIGNGVIRSDSGELELLALEPFPDAGVEKVGPYRLVVRLTPDP